MARHPKCDLMDTYTIILKSPNRDSPEKYCNRDDTNRYAADE